MVRRHDLPACSGSEVSRRVAARKDISVDWIWEVMKQGYDYPNRRAVENQQAVDQRDRLRMCRMVLLMI